MMRIQVDVKNEKIGMNDEFQAATKVEIKIDVKMNDKQMRILK